MKIELDLDIAEGNKDLPTEEQFLGWIGVTLKMANYTLDEVELSIMVVSEAVSRTLNAQYRGKDYPTNVLSFPADIPEYVETSLIGDLVICANIVKKEAEEQKKALMDHWAHLTVHGCLHLLGYDHEKDEEAEFMEALEVKILAALDIANPYVERA